MESNHTMWLDFYYADNIYEWIKKNKILMNKIKEIYNFIINNLNGERTKITIGVILIVLLFKFFGVIGLTVAMLVSIAMDICKTTNFKTIYKFLKKQFFRNEE